MCKALLHSYLTNPKFDWLKKDLPNPYANTYDKLDFIASILFFIPFFLQSSTAIRLYMPIIGLIAIFGVIRHIKTVPGDIEQVIMKPMLCYEIIFSHLFLIGAIVQALGVLLSN